MKKNFYIYWTKSPKDAAYTILNTENKIDFSRRHQISISINCAYIVSDSKLLAWIPEKENIYDDFDFTKSPPIKFDNFGSKKVSKIFCNNSVCHIITEEGLVYSWGSDRTRTGILGQGEVYYITRPTKNQFLANKIIDLSLSEKHCAAIADNHLLITWGFGTCGELGGEELYEKRNVPQFSKYGKYVSKVKCGFNYTSFIDHEGSAVYYGICLKKELIPLSSKRNGINSLKKIKIGKYKVDCVYCGNGIIGIVDMSGNMFLYNENEGAFLVKLYYSVSCVKFVYDNVYALSRDRGVLYEFTSIGDSIYDFFENVYVCYDEGIKEIRLIDTPYYDNVLFFGIFSCYNSLEMKKSLAELFKQIKNNDLTSRDDPCSYIRNYGDCTLLRNSSSSCLTLNSNRNLANKKSIVNSPNSFSSLNSPRNKTSRIERISSLLEHLLERKIDTISRGSSFMQNGKKRIEVQRVDKDFQENFQKKKIHQRSASCTSGQESIDVRPERNLFRKNIRKALDIFSINPISWKDENRKKTKEKFKFKEYTGVLKGKNRETRAELEKNIENENENEAKISLSNKEEKSQIKDPFKYSNEFCESDDDSKKHETIQGSISKFASSFSSIHEKRPVKEESFGSEIQSALKTELEPPTAISRPGPRAISKNRLFESPQERLEKTPMKPKRKNKKNILCVDQNNSIEYTSIKKGEAHRTEQRKIMKTLLHDHHTTSKIPFKRLKGGVRLINTKFKEHTEKNKRKEQKYQFTSNCSLNRKKNFPEVFQTENKGTKRVPSKTEKQANDSPLLFGKTKRTENALLSSIFSSLMSKSKSGNRSSAERTTNLNMINQVSRDYKVLQAPSSPVKVMSNRFRNSSQKANSGAKTSRILTKIKSNSMKEKEEKKENSRTERLRMRYINFLEKEYNNGNKNLNQFMNPNRDSEGLKQEGSTTSNENMSLISNNTGVLEDTYSQADMISVDSNTNGSVYSMEPIELEKSTRSMRRIDYKHYK